MPRVRSLRLGIALLAAAVVILSAPFAQQAFTELGAYWPAHFRLVITGASAVPAAGAFLVALWRIRDRRLLRYLLAGSGFAFGGAYIVFAGLTFSESFHFIEYGLLAVLFYRVWRFERDVPRHDWSVVALPLLATAIAGTIDEWFQWFIPIRAGEARDVLLNAAAGGCGLLIAAAIEPPGQLHGLDRRSRLRVAAGAGAALVLFALFFQTVHMGHTIRDPEIGSFRSRFTAVELARSGLDRRQRWVTQPPVVQRRIAREDQYLTEALWHVQRRNEAWSAGDVATAWRENRILEKFYAPVLDTPTYAGRAGHRWPASQRSEAAARGTSAPHDSAAYPYPLFAWPGPTLLTQRWP